MMEKAGGAGVGGGGGVDAHADLLAGLVGETVSSLFNATAVSTMPLLNLRISSVRNDERPIPCRWVEESTIDDVVAFEGHGDGDALALSRGPSIAPSTSEAVSPCSAQVAATGAQKLREALARLSLSPNPVEAMDVKQWSKAGLTLEKKKVKHELKLYDTHFKKTYDKLPTRAEKEPMRPLYTYYRHLKALLQAQGGVGEPEGPEEWDVAGPHSAVSPASEESQRSGARRLRSALSEPTTSASGGSPSPDTRLAQLKADKNTIRIRLQKYQDNFFAEHGRKIRFYRDILPIERDYRLYKQLKHDILKLDQQLGYQPVAGGGGKGGSPNASISIP